MAEDFRVSLSREAHMGLMAEAALRNTTLKKLASELLWNSLSPSARQFVGQK